MSLEQDVAELRQEVRFLSVTLRCVFSVLLGIVTLMTVGAALSASTFQRIFADLLGGARLPTLTEFILEWHLVIVGSVGVLGVVVIALVLSLNHNGL